jgi:hypothetical protein
MSIRDNAMSYKRIPVAILFILGTSAAFCQLNSNTASVALRATLGESLTVAATPSAVAIPLVAGGTATGTSPVAITTTWVLSASHPGQYSRLRSARPGDDRYSDILHCIYPDRARGHSWSGADAVYPGTLGSQPNRQPDR